MPAPAPYRHASMLIAATACWGVGTVVTKQVLDEDVAPLTLLTIQLASSCLFVGAMCRLQQARFDWSPRLRRLAALGVLNPGIAYALGLIGLSSITASLSVLLWAAEPVLDPAASRRRCCASTSRSPWPRRWVPACSASCWWSTSPARPGTRVGIALTLTAVAACALYAVLTRRLLLDDASLAVVLVHQGAALAFACAAHSGRASREGRQCHVDLPTGPTWITAAASGVLYYGLAYWFFLSGLNQVPASYAGRFFPLIPVFGLAAGFVVGERLVERQWIGVALIDGATAATAVRQARLVEPRA